jgi:hypothetical protein
MAPRVALRSSVRAVGSYVPALTRKAFEKHGFSTAVLLTDWARIVGAEVAASTAPERLKWPRGVEAYGEVETGAEGRPGATLVVQVDPARALDVDYRSRQIVERINAFFGYRAVAALKLVQAPIAAPEARPQGPIHRDLGLEPAERRPVDDVADADLRAALLRLGAGVAAQQGKL